jgi:glycosyltransferase involved in cell wall biosynthesis
MSSSPPRRLCCYLDSESFGGAERTLAVLLEGLNPRDEVQLVVTDETIGAEIARSRPGTHVTPVPQVTSKLDLSAIRAHQKVFRAAKPDLFLISHRQLYAAQYGIVAAALTRRPIVSVVHCVVARTDVIQTNLMRGASKFVARFVGVSDSVARDTESQLHLAPGTVDVIYNGVPQTTTPTTPPHPRDSARRLLGCVGRLSPEKGYDVALHALAALPDCELVILGEGPQLGKLRRIAASLGINDRVRFEGWVPPPWTDSWRFDALLVPSHYEGFGLVAVEAMLAGIPVIASDVAALREVLSDEKTGLLVQPGRPDELARAAQRLLDDDELREELVAHAREDARQRFSVSTMVGSYEALFDDLLRAR